jgi:protein gp37
MLRTCGESGSKFRPMQDSWALELRDACKRGGVGFYFKHRSSFKPGQRAELEGKSYREAPLVQITERLNTKARRKAGGSLA